MSVQKENNEINSTVIEDSDLQFLSLEQENDKEKPMTTESKKRKKPRRLKKSVRNALCIMAGMLVILYIGLSVFFMNHYYIGTTINDTSYAGDTVKGATTKIVDVVDGYELKMIGRNNQTEVIKGADVALEYQFDDTLERVAQEQNGWLWFTALFKDCKYDLPKAATFDEKALESKIRNLTFFKVKGEEPPQNAYISEYQEGSGYTIIEEVKGNMLDKEKAIVAIKNAMSMVDEELDLDASECYVEPDITKDSEALQKVCKTLNDYTGVTIIYDFDFATEKLTGEQIHEWLTYDNSKIAIDEEKARECINAIARKYDTFGKNRKFTTISGNQLELLSGGYGWRVDRASETEQTIADIKAGKDVTRKMIYSSEGYVRKDNGEGGVDDIGDTYVEINLGTQHLYVIKNGSVMEESDFVSGNISKGNGTPSGVFGITYKEKDAVLTGANYESDVNYWMPFNGNIGMHDATWRKQFGGEIYKTNGSHGCVNLPLKEAEKIYGLVEKGMPVVCYY